LAFAGKLSVEVFDDEVSDVPNVAGSILPINVHRFFEDDEESEVDATEVVDSLVSTLVKLVRDDCRLYTKGCGVVVLLEASPSKLRNMLGAGSWLSFRIMRRRLPGAG
jgi:hypothetical protein